MLIVCPTCATTYKIQLAALGAAGRSVRCTHCKNTWFATPDSMVEETAMAPAAAVNREPAPTPAPPRPAADDFPDEMASEFSVEGVAAPDDTSVDESEKALAEGDAPPLAPTDPSEAEDDAASKFDPGVPDVPDVPDNIETIAARRARQTFIDRKDHRALLQRLVSLPMLIFVLLVILVSVLSWRVAVVRHLPQTASLFSAIGMPVNLRGLHFEDVKSTSEFHEGVMVLVIEGTIVNLTRQTLEVPRLRFSLRSSQGLEVYAWTALPSKTLLGSGDGLPFRTRLASPPSDGRDVIVRFFNRRDVSAGSP